MKIEDFEEMIKKETEFLVETDMFLVSDWIRICDKTGDRVVLVKRNTLKNVKKDEVLEDIKKAFEDID